MTAPSRQTGSRLLGLARQAARPDVPPAGGPGAGEAAQPCDLCAEPLPTGHRHLLDLSTSAAVCACRACALLFDQRAAGGSHYRLLPERRVPLEGFALDDTLWAGLGVPVGLAFFTRAAPDGEVRAGYPGPLGITRSTVPADTWREVVAGHPALAGLADDVEALLVDRSGGTREHWLVPVDDCYRLVALVRTHWKGLAGGPEVREHLARFFRGLRERA